MVSPTGDFDVARASDVLAAALDRPGGAAMVLGALGEIAGVQFEPERPGKLFRRGAPARLTVGDWQFITSGPADVRVQVCHAVRGVALQTATAGPAEASRRLAEELFALTDSGGSDAAMQTQAALYGIAAINEM